MKKSLLFISACLISANAFGQWAVFDASNFQRNVITAKNSAQTVVNQVQQIEYQIRMINNQVKALERLSDSDFWASSGVLDKQLHKLEGVASRVLDADRRIAGVIDSINIFTTPKIDIPGGGQNPARAGVPGGGQNPARAGVPGGGQNPTRTHPTSQPTLTAERLNSWEQDLVAATQAALDSQATIEEVRLFTEQARDVLSQSAQADGQVRQMQSTNLMLGIISTQLGSLAMSTGGAARLAAADTSVETAKEASLRQETDAFLRNPELIEGNEQVFTPGHAR